MSGDGSGQVNPAIEELAPPELRRRAETVPIAEGRTLLDELCDQSVRLLRVDLDRAAAVADSARVLAERLGDGYAWGRYLRARANLENFGRDYQAAAASYAAAIERFDAAGEAVQAAVTRTSGVVSLISLGRYREAEAWVEAARHQLEGAGDDLRVARLEFAVGNIRARQDRFAEALEHYRRAHREFELAGSPYEVGMSLRNIAVCLQDLNELAASDTAYRRARRYCAENDLPLLVLETECNLSYLHFLRGEYARAIASFEAARRASEAAGDEHHRALCDLDLAEILLELNLADDAAALAERGHAGFERLGMGYEAAKALTFQALALGRTTGAGAALDRLAEARARFAAEGNPVWPWRIDLHRAHLLAVEGRGVEAGELAAAASAALSRAGIPKLAAMGRLLCARLSMDGGDAEAARHEADGVLAALAGLGLPEIEFRALVVRGRGEEALGRPDKARASYVEAERRLEALRGQIVTDELKIAFLEDKLHLFEDLFRMALGGVSGEPDAAAAFGYAEKAKSRSLAELLAFRAQSLEPRSAAAEPLVARIRAARERVAAIERQIDRRLSAGVAMASEALAALRGQRLEAERELRRLTRELRHADRDLDSLQVAEPPAADDLRAALPEGTRLVEYFAAAGRIYALVLGAGLLEVRPLAEVSRVAELDRALRFQLDKFTRGSRGPAALLEFAQHATDVRLETLYRELVAPLEPHLDAEHLVIVPHGALHWLPFHALRDGEVALADRCTISYAPSASVFELCSRRRPAAAGPPLVLGVADPRAPLIEREARAVAAALPEANLLLGDEADLRALRRLGSGASHIHLATHGFFRRDHPMFSAIRLGRERLSVHDLYDLRLEAELVVLSGCATGLGVVRGGDELVGLTRGWLYAGARALVVSLWEVNDESTALFMQAFYRRLGAAEPPAAALRGAMLELRETYPHPYYWAPFCLVGWPFAAAEAPSPISGKAGSHPIPV